VALTCRPPRATRVSHPLVATLEHDFLVCRRSADEQSPAALRADHSSVPCSSVFVRVIWCGLDNRTPISSQPSALTASGPLPSHAPY
jgi:hypothetical protein